MVAEGSADISKLADALRQSANDSQMTTQQVLIQASNQILAEMEAKVPVKTGKLRHSLRIEVGTERVVIGPNLVMAPYAPYVEFGTRAHEIRPKNPKGVLVFKVGDTTVYAKKVHHPGTKANPFVKDSFMAWVDSLGTMAAEANVKVISENGP